jgi:hypothetical protein
MIRFQESRGDLPSQYYGSPHHGRYLAALLTYALRKSECAFGAVTWGFVLTGVAKSDVGYGHLCAVTPGALIVPLTPPMVTATEGREMYLHGHIKVEFTIPRICLAMGPDEPLPAVDVRCDLGHPLPVDGDRLEARIDSSHAGRAPLVVLAPNPIPGWPR